MGIPLQRKGAWVLSLALVVIGGGIGYPFQFAALGVEPSALPEKGKKFFHVKMDQPYTYQVGNRRDPFVPLPISQSRDDSPIPAVSDLDNAEDMPHVLGIILGKRGYQALLQLPNGERHMVGPGSLLENISLTIKRITNDAIVVAQPLEGKGDSRILETTLFLSH